MATKSSNIFLWIIGIFGAVQLLRKTDIVDTITNDLYAISNPRINLPQISFLNTNLNGSIDILNKTAITPRVDQVIGKLLVRRKEIGFFDTRDVTFLRASNTTSVPFTVTLENLNVISSLIEEFQLAASNGTSVPNITMRGVAVINGVRVPFNEKYLG